MKSSKRGTISAIITGAIVGVYYNNRPQRPSVLDIDRSARSQRINPDDLPNTPEEWEQMFPPPPLPEGSVHEIEEGPIPASTNPENLIFPWLRFEEADSAPSTPIEEQSQDNAAKQELSQG